MKRLVFSMLNGCPKWPWVSIDEFKEWAICCDTTTNASSFPVRLAINIDQDRGLNITVTGMRDELGRLYVRCGELLKQLNLVTF